MFFDIKPTQKSAHHFSHSTGRNLVSWPCLTKEGYEVPSQGAKNLGRRRHSLVNSNLHHIKMITPEIQNALYTQWVSWGHSE